MLLEFPFFMWVILVVSKPRFGMKVTLSATGVVTAVYMLALYVVNHNWYTVIHSHPTWDLIYRVAGILFMAMAALCLTKQRPVQSLFAMASVYMLITVADALSSIAFLLFGWEIFVSQLLLFGVWSPLIYKARRPITMIMSQTKKGWWLLCSVPLFMIGSFLLIAAVPVSLAQNPARIPAALIFCATSIIIYITFFYMMWQFYKQSQLEHNVMALRLSVSDLERQNELIQQSEKRYALFRHDVRHITDMISSCLSQNDIAGALTWLKPLTQNIRTDISFSSHVFTGHTLPDAVLSRYIEQAAGLGIDINVRINMGEIKADMTELAVVLANALENAVKACLEIKESKAHEKSRVIRINGQQRGAQFFLEIANTFSGEVMIDPDTGLPLRKTDSENTQEQEHGLGSQSIAYFAEKHHAVLQYQIDKGWFRLRLLI